MFEQIVIEVIASLISAIILAVLGFGIYLAFYLKERQGLLRFFGVSKKLPRLRIYLSRMEIKPGGTVGFEPVSQGYSGPSISEVEYEGALLIRNRLRSTLVALLPKRVQYWLGQHHITLLTLDPPVDVCPQALGDLALDNRVTLGSSIYNLYSKHYLEYPCSQFYFFKTNNGERVIRIRSRGLKDVEIPGRSAERELGVIQRIIDSAHGNTVFICAGLGASATYGCARYLIENWKKLFRKYGDTEFGICLAFPQQPPDSEIVVDPIVVYPPEL
jgi:hypothetical protein